MDVRERITGMEGNGPPPEAPGMLYPGSVMHARMKPFAHRFTYRVFSLLADIDRLAELDRMSVFLSVNRGNLVSLHEADHVEHEGETLRAFVDRLLAGAGLREPAHRVLLLAYPRVLGYVFNPLSVFFAYDASGDPIALIYCVRNTFGQRHNYVAPIEDGDLSPSGIRQSRAKLFHVSPFIGMEARYDFRILPPGQAVSLRINETEHGEPLLAATFHGKAVALDTAGLLSCLLRTPLMTWKVIAGIHWQALKLWRKGARFHPSPPMPKQATSYDNEARMKLEAGE